MTSLTRINEKKEKRKYRLEKSLNSLLHQLVELGALKVILFGSMVNGTIDIDSDLDLLVVMPASRSGQEWQNYIYEQVYRSTAADIFVYNENEFEKYRESSFLQNVIYQGRVMYEKL